MEKQRAKRKTERDSGVMAKMCGQIERYRLNLRVKREMTMKAKHEKKTAKIVALRILREKSVRVVMLVVQLLLML